jgi:four helix bundle protein
MTFKTFEEIESWKKARILVRRVYEVTRGGSFSRDYGLRDQIRRASISIPSNIAEGFERGGSGEFIQFLGVAKGSCGEVRSQIYTALDLGYLREAEFRELHELARETSKLIAGLIGYLKKSPIRGPRHHKEEAGGG